MTTSKRHRRLQSSLKKKTQLGSGAPSLREQQARLRITGSASSPKEVRFRDLYHMKPLKAAVIKAMDAYEPSDERERDVLAQHQRKLNRRVDDRAIIIMAITYGVEIDAFSKNPVVATEALASLGELPTVEVNP